MSTMIPTVTTPAMEPMPDAATQVPIEAGDAAFADALLALMGMTEPPAETASLPVPAAGDSTDTASEPLSGEAVADLVGEVLQLIQATPPAVAAPPAAPPFSTGVLPLSLAMQRDEPGETDALTGVGADAARESGDGSDPALLLTLLEATDATSAAPEAFFRPDADPAPDRATAVTGEGLRTMLGGDAWQSHRVATDAPARPPATGHVPTPLSSPQWAQDFAARVSWIVDRGDQAASISLSPEELGPVEIRVAIREGEASIWFGAAQPETRQAIEQAIPRLREMLSASGLSLADAGVYKQAPRDPQRGFLRSDSARATRETVDAGSAQVGIRRLGLIDDYA